MNQVFYVLSVIATVVILWFLGLALTGLVAKLIYRSLLVGWNLV
jgi:hypothetical protein